MMDFTPRYSARSKSESSAATCKTVPIGCQLNFKSHWHNNMYPMHTLDTLNKQQQLLRESIDKNNANFSFRMYSTKQSLNNDTIPKKETLWQSFFRSATNLLGEHLTRGTSSFLRNWSNMNNPLSVTVVSPDFYKSVQHDKEHELTNSAEEFFLQRMWSKESHRIGETFLYDNESMSDSAKRSNSDSSDSDKRWKEYKCMFVDFNKSQEKETMENEETVNSVNTSEHKDEDLDSHFNVIVIDEKGLTLKEDEEPEMIEKPKESITELREKEGETTAKTPLKSTSVTTMLTNAYNKVVDYLQLGSTTPEPKSVPEPSNLDIDAIDFDLDVDLDLKLDNETYLLYTKRGCSPKTRPKRLHDVSSGRGRGRAKSQLRRSGVSQSRHRKERNRYERAADIKCDIERWEELQYCAEDVDEVDHVAPKISSEDLVELRRPTNFTFGDTKFQKYKPKKNKKSSPRSQFAFNRKELEDSHLGQKPAFRPRLLSDSSVDSEDSYCIVFEDDSCNKDCDFETDIESYDETEETDSDEEDDEEEMEEDDAIELVSNAMVNRTKVRFNPMPIVRTMIHWNYAYRAARRGPWEQIARDRERFRARISSVGNVLEPVLTKQHRMHVWCERFDHSNYNF